MADPEFWIIAGINGAGKTTLVSRGDMQSLIGPIELLNPDVIAEALRREEPARSLEQANLLAAQRIEDEVDRRIERRSSFLVETVLSSPKYFKRIESARAHGFRICMIYVGLPAVELAVARVQDRVALQGHDVPEAKIRGRWARSYDNLVALMPLIDHLFVFSNADPTGNPVLVATKHGDDFTLLVPGELPELDKRLPAAG